MIRQEDFPCAVLAGIAGALRALSESELHLVEDSEVSLWRHERH